MARRVEIVRRGLLAQKWYARFIADNDLRLARTTEHYWNLADLKAMLANYFPGLAGDYVIEEAAMTAADHANTVREALNIGPLPDNQSDRGKLDAGHDALDALQAQAEAASAVDWKAVAKDYETQAEAAEAERDELRATLDITHDTNAKLEAERDRLEDVIRAQWPRKAERIIRAALAHTEQT